MHEWMYSIAMRAEKRGKKDEWVGCYDLLSFEKRLGIVRRGFAVNVRRSALFRAQSVVLLRPFELDMFGSLDFQGVRHGWGRDPPYAQRRSGG